MALLDSKDGCICDLCGVSSRGDFTYYSLDFTKRNVKDDRQLAQNMPSCLSLDLCTNCFTIMKETVFANYKPSSEHINCDLCGVSMSGTFSYYFCAVAKVDVCFSKATALCANCRKDITKCGCAISKPVKTAAVRVDKDHLQLPVCQADYDQLSKRRP